MKYFIYWKSMLTGYIGHSRCFDVDKKKMESIIMNLDTSWKGVIVHYYLELQYYDTFINEGSNWPIGI